MTTNLTIPADLTAALTRLEEALRAMGAGDPAPYAALWHRDADVTLFGAWGPIELGHDAVTATFAWVASRFSGGARSCPNTQSSPRAAISPTRSGSNAGGSAWTAQSRST